MTPEMFENYNRLLSEGLDQGTALKVLLGELDEKTEVSIADEEKKVRAWSDVAGWSPPQSLLPIWDLLPCNFHFALDHCQPGDLNPEEYDVIHADLQEVLGLLTRHSSRVKDPWHHDHKWKSSKTVYRWKNGLGVTPPLITPTEQLKIALGGGFHRFHLAAHYNVSRIPLLVLKNQVEATKNILSTAS